MPGYDLATAVVGNVPLGAPDGNQKVVLRNNT